MVIKIIRDKTPVSVLKEIARETFGIMVKAVVDVEKGIMAVGGELHSDEEALLIEMGSKQENLWGINIYPEMNGDKFIDFYSLINLRPAQGNRSFGVDDPQVKKKIAEIVNELIER